MNHFEVHCTETDLLRKRMDHFEPSKLNRRISKKQVVGGSGITCVRGFERTNEWIQGEDELPKNRIFWYCCVCPKIVHCMALVEALMIS